MTNEQPITCVQCGLVLSTGGGRCPQCGAVQPELAPPDRRQGATVGIAVRPTPDRRPSSMQLVGLAAGGVVAVVALGLGVRALLPKPRADAAVQANRPGTTAAAPVSETALGGEKLNPSQVLVQAKIRALAWDPHAQLLEARFGPVVGGKVDVTKGATFEVIYGKPAGKKLGPGAPVGTARLAVIVDAKGTRTEERTREKPGTAVAEPDCPFVEAWRKLSAAGVPANAKLAVRYELSSKHQRGTWVVEVEGQTDQPRTLDGRACRFLLP